MGHSLWSAIIAYAVRDEAQKDFMIAMECWQLARLGPDCHLDNTIFPLAEEFIGFGNPVQ